MFYVVRSLVACLRICLESSSESASLVIKVFSESEWGFESMRSYGIPTGILVVVKPCDSGRDSLMRFSLG